MSRLRDKARHAVAWNTGFNLFRDLLQFGVMLVLVRLLEPSMYGQFGLVNSIIGFINIFAFHNFLGHTLQVRSDKELHYQEHFTAGAVIQVTLFIATNLLALVLRYFESYAEITLLIHVMSVVFLLELPCNFRIKMLERLMDWKRLRLTHVIGLITSSVLSIAMALSGAGVYALLVPGLMVTLPFIYELFIINKWRPRWTWNAKNYREAWSFGLSRMNSGLVVNGRIMMESNIVMQFVGFNMLGFFGRSVGLAQMFCHKLSFQLMYAIYPVLTRIDPGTERFKHVSGMVLRTVSWVVIPVAAIFTILAEPVVNVVYGDKWLEVIPLLPWAMTAGATSAIAHSSYMLLLANQKQKLCLLYDIFIFLGTGASLVLLLPQGIIPYMQGIALVQFLGLTINLFFLHFVHGIMLTGMLGAIVPPLTSTAFSLAVCEAFKSWNKMPVDSFMPAFEYGIIFGIIFIISMRFFFRSLLAELVEYLPGKHLFGHILMLKLTK